MTDGDLFARLRRLTPARRRALVARLSAAEVAVLTSWEMTARPAQLPPPGMWRTWLMLAGRGFGKTRAGAEWIRSLAEGDGRLRIALVGASAGEARAVMVEGESGLLAVAPSTDARPRWEPSRGLLVWPSGARALIYSAEAPERLRGPQHHAAGGPGPEGNHP